MWFLRGSIVSLRRSSSWVYGLWRKSSWGEVELMIGWKMWGVIWAQCGGGLWRSGVGSRWPPRAEPEPGACRCTWDAAMGLLIDLNRHSAPTFIWVPATEAERPAQLCSFRSDPRTVRHEGEILTEQKSWEVYFVNPSSVCFLNFGSCY